MPTATKKTSLTIRLEQTNPPDPRRLVLVRVGARGLERQRIIGPRARLSLDEAAVVLDRPRAQVQQAIRTGFLRALPGRRAVTLQACAEFRREELQDAAAAATRGQRTYPADEVHREVGL